MLSGVLFGRKADHCFEIFDQVRLIEITQFGRQLRPIRRFSVRRAENRLVNPAAPDDPFRADSDVFIEQELQRSFVDAELADGIVHFDDVAVGHHAVHDAADETGTLVPFRHQFTQKPLRQRDHFLIAVRGQNVAFRRFRIFPEQFPAVNGTVGQPGNLLAIEGPKPSRLEQDAEHFAPPCENMLRFSSVNAVDFRFSLFENQIHARVL